MQLLLASYRQHITKNDIFILLILNRLDPYQRAEGKETVLHWACQCNTKNNELLQQLLDFKNEE